MGLFGQMGNMYKLQKEAKKIKDELEKTHITAEENGIKIIVNGEQKLLAIEISDDAMTEKKKLEKTMVEVLNRAIKKAQLHAAEKMKPILGNFRT